MEKSENCSLKINGKRLHWTYVWNTLNMSAGVFLSAWAKFGRNSWAFLLQHLSRVPPVTQRGAFCSCQSCLDFFLNFFGFLCKSFSFCFGHRLGKGSERKREACKKRNKGEGDHLRIGVFWGNESDMEMTKNHIQCCETHLFQVSDKKTHLFMCLMFAEDWARVVPLCVVGRTFHRSYCKHLSLVTNFGS